MTTERVVKTANGDVTVKKLTLRQYASVFKAITDLPKKIGSLLKEGQKISDETIIEVLPMLIGDALPDFCRIMVIASDKDEEFFMNLDLSDFTGIIVAAFELNDFSGIVANIKKLTARKVSPAK